MIGVSGRLGGYHSDVGRFDVGLWTLTPSAIVLTEPVNLTIQFGLNLTDSPKTFTIPGGTLVVQVRLEGKPSDLVQIEVNNANPS